MSKNQVTPRKLTVTKHFANAKEIRCLKTGMLVDISLPSEPRLVEGEYVLGNGSLVIWSEGNYAEITKKVKECNCTNCKCDKKNDLKLKSPK